MLFISFQNNICTLTLGGKKKRQWNYKSVAALYKNGSLETFKAKQLFNNGLTKT